MEGISKKNLLYFFISLFLSLPFWWEINIFQKDLEDTLFWSQAALDPQVLQAQIGQKNDFQMFRPQKIGDFPELQLSASSAIAVFVGSQGNPRVLFEKEKDLRLPIASLTKLMTANVALLNYDPNLEVVISEDAVGQEEDFGGLKVGENFKIKDLVYMALIESSNDAAFALSEILGEKNFVGLMNVEAANFNMADTFYINSTGLDLEEKQGKEKLISYNYSTAFDLEKLAEYLLVKKPDIFEITKLAEYDLYTPDGAFHHKIKNTNELLNQLSEEKIFGGKTGWTPLAQGCLILIVEAPNRQGKIINVVLGSPDRFAEMQNLVNWEKQAFKW